MYKQQIVNFSSDGFSLDYEMYETLQRSFVKLTLDLLGEQNKKLLVRFFGNYQTLINNMILYMKEQLEDDQLLKYVEQAEKAQINQE